MNSKQESERRLKLAQRHLVLSQEAYKRDDYPEVVHHAQLCVENSAKSIISLFRIPSWSHDVSDELKDTIKDLEIPQSLKKNIDSLIEVVAELAPEHAKSNYGTLTQLPDELYKKEDATLALRYAKEAFETAKKFIKWWFSS